MTCATNESVLLTPDQLHNAEQHEAENRNRGQGMKHREGVNDVFHIQILMISRGLKGLDIVAETAIAG